MNTTAIREAIENSLNDSICIELGIMPLAVKANKIEIGAMNPSYPKLLEYVNELDSLHGINAEVVFVDSSVWEKWYDQDEGARFSHLRSIHSELQDTIEKSELDTEELVRENVKSDTSEIEDYYRFK